jgi:uroporphyrinogen III methyltransferase/synthase
LKGKELLGRADVVLYDYLSAPEILDHAPADVERIYVGKKAADHAIPQSELNELLVKLSQEGKTVVRLKGGDPYMFGRGGEEAQELRAAGVPFEVVPGISSTIAGPGYAGIPVTHRDHCSQLTIFTGHEDPTKDESSLDYKKIAEADGTKVMLMGVGQLARVTGELLKEGADPKTPVALVRWATTGRQQTLVSDLENVAKRVEETGFKSPAVTVIGDVVGLREELDWFESRPLFGKKIVVTRTRKQAGQISVQLRSLGADVDEMPTIRIDPPDDLMGFGELVQDCHKYAWIVFTSPNGVDAFFDMFYKLYHDARSIGGARIAAVGPGTAKKIKEYHLAVDLLPDEYVAEGLLKKMLETESFDNEAVLWVRPAEARDVIGAGLSEAGAIVDQAIAYQTFPETGDPTGAVARFRDEGADVITFASSSAVEHFLDLGLELPERLKIASIGPVTSEALQSAGLDVDIEATEHNIPGLVAAIRRYYEEL